MAVRNILVWPNPGLLKASKPVEAINDEIHALVADMFDTMYEYGGIGLAAPQIGVHLRVVVLDHFSNQPKPERKPLALVNPVLSDFSTEEVGTDEGCLSVPGEVGRVTRKAACTVSFKDMMGKDHVVPLTGIKAICLQHECDHLDGKVYVQYLSRLRRDVIRRKMMKLSTNA